MILTAPARIRFGVLAFAAVLAVAAGPAHAQDEDEADEDQPPIVVDISGPCALSFAGQPADCQGVSYMAFPANHRIDFTALDGQSGWAFSGEEDDNEDGRYVLTLDSVINADLGRIDAEGQCDMQMGSDRRTVTSLDCSAETEAGRLVLRASGVIAASTDGDDDDDEDDGDEPDQDVG